MACFCISSVKHFYLRDFFRSFVKSIILIKCTVNISRSKWRFFLYFVPWTGALPSLPRSATRDRVRLWKIIILKDFKTWRNLDRRSNLQTFLISFFLSFDTFGFISYNRFSDLTFPFKKIRIKFTRKFFKVYIYVYKYLL